MLLFLFPPEGKSEARKKQLEATPQLWDSAYISAGKKNNWSICPKRLVCLKGRKLKCSQTPWAPTLDISTYFHLLAASYGLHFKQNMWKKMAWENCYVSYLKIIIFLKNLSLLNWIIWPDKILEETEEFKKMLERLWSYYLQLSIVNKPVGEKK